MDKKASLLLLINQSYLLNQDIKKDLQQKIPSMSDEEVMSLGRVLALEKKATLESQNEVVIKELLDQILQKR